MPGIIPSISMMKTKAFSWVATGFGVIFLAVLLMMNANAAYSDINKFQDGTLTLDEFDILGKNPIKTNQIVKEAE